MKERTATMYLALLLIGFVLLMIIVSLIFVFRKKKAPPQSIEPVQKEVEGYTPQLMPKRGDSLYTATPFNEVQQRESDIRSSSFRQTSSQLNLNSIPSSSSSSMSTNFRDTSAQNRGSDFNFTQSSSGRELQRQKTDTNPRSLNKLKSVYERGISAWYDDKLDAAFLVFTDCVMYTSEEVDLGFATTRSKLRAAMAPKGLERCGWIADIGGLTIGKDVTKEWGTGLKKLLEDLNIKVGKDNYLVARYNSRLPQTSTEEIRDKVRNIQFMTTAVVNNFQSNIFGTKEEAIAFYLRQRELANLR